MNDEPRIGGYYNVGTILKIILFNIIIIGLILFTLPWQSYQEMPYYNHNNDAATSIFYKYDLKNNSNLTCNGYGCNSINPIMASAWKELCNKNGICSEHDAFHFWYSENPEVIKTKEHWKELYNRTKE